MRWERAKAILAGFKKKYLIQEKRDEEEKPFGG
jgi:hypothetical protein